MRNACQFSFMCDGKAEYIGSLGLLIGEVAEMLNGAPARPKGALVRRKSVSPRWIKKMHRTATIGYHHFYVAKK